MSYTVKLVLMSIVLVMTVMASLLVGITAPQMMTFQGRLASSTGTPLDGVYSLTFTIYDDSIATAPGNIKWQETHPIVNVSDGLFSVVLGQGNPAVPLTEAVFEGSPRFLEAKVAGDPTPAKRVRIVSVAYSLVTQFADTANIAMNLKLPVSDTVESSGVALAIANNGTGSAALFRNNNPASTSAALRAVSAGTGEAVFGRQNGCYVAGQFQIDNPGCNHAALVGFTNGGGAGVYGWTSGNGPAVQGWTSGGGSAGLFAIDNPASGAQALSIFTNGLKEAVFARTVGDNPAGNFIIENPANNHSALIGSTDGSGIGVLGRTTGNGTGIRGETNGLGVAGDFASLNPASNSITLSVYTAGNGPGLLSRTVGGGRAGIFYIDDPFNGMEALYVSTIGSGPAATFEGGNVGIRTTAATSSLDVSGVTGFNQLRMRNSYTPTSSGDLNGNVGDVAWDNNFFYIKTNAGWKRSSLSSW